MKNLAIIALLAVGVCAAQAQDKKPEPGKDAPKRGGGFRGGDFLKELNLTADQQAKLDAFTKEQREKMSGFKDLSQEQRTAKYQEIGKARQEFMEKLLTAEQNAKLKEINAKRGAGRPGGPGKAPEKK